MAKWAGKIGFLITEEKKGSIWEEHVIEKPYTGDVISATYRNAPASEKLNDDLSVTQDLSIVADNFAINNAYRIRYATMLGGKWKVTTIKPQFPRLVLSIGGLYNGPEPDEDEET